MLSSLISKYFAWNCPVIFCHLAGSLVLLASMKPTSIMSFVGTLDLIPLPSEGLWTGRMILFPLGSQAWQQCLAHCERSANANRMNQAQLSCALYLENSKEKRI